VKYVIKKYVDEWYLVSKLYSTTASNLFKCDTIDGVKQLLLKIEDI